MASEYIKYQLKDVKPKEKPPELTPKEKFLNWLYYYKWYLVAAAVMIGVLLDIGLHILNERRNAPDYQIAYIGSSVLPNDTEAALTEAFSALGTDANENGNVRTVLNSYALDGADETTAAELGEYSAASQIRLIGDMENCESYFFLVDDPAHVQESYQILADKDGRLLNPDSENPAEFYALPLSECPALAAVLDGTYHDSVSGEEISGTNRDFLQDLYLARRAFPEGRECANKEACDLLWEKLTK